MANSFGFDRTQIHNTVLHNFLKINQIAVKEKNVENLTDKINFKIVG
jgi:hypothetical protein